MTDDAAEEMRAIELPRLRRRAAAVNEGAYACADQQR
jgi:hypothetical protein